MLHVGPVCFLEEMEERRLGEERMKRGRWCFFLTIVCLGKFERRDYFSLFHTHFCLVHGTRKEEKALW